MEGGQWWRRNTAEGHSTGYSMRAGGGGHAPVGRAQGPQRRHMPSCPVASLANGCRCGSTKAHGWCLLPLPKIAPALPAGDSVKADEWGLVSGGPASRHWRCRAWLRHQRGSGWGSVGSCRCSSHRRCILLVQATAEHVERLKGAGKDRLVAALHSVPGGRERVHRVWGSAAEMGDRYTNCQLLTPACPFRDRPSLQQAQPRSCCAAGPQPTPSLMPAMPSHACRRVVCQGCAGQGRSAASRS